jgi:hypothetical protein
MFPPQTQRFFIDLCQSLYPIDIISFFVFYVSLSLSVQVGTSIAEKRNGAGLRVWVQIAKAGEILIGSGACDLIKDKNILKVEERAKMPVKGRKKEVSIFNVVGLDEVQY